MSLFARIFGTRSSQELEARLLPFLKMMTMDGRRDPKEFLALSVHISQMGITPERAAQLVAQAGVGTEIPFPTDPRHKIEVLLGAAAMMVSDGDIAVDELGYLHFLAARMEIPAPVLSDVINKAIALGESMNPGVDLRTDFESALMVLAAQVTR
jgi:hypothetical protein